MQIYFAGSIAGGRKYLETYTKIVKFLQDKGHHIPTEHIIYPDVLTFENDSTPEDIYNRDVEWLEGSTALVAEISNPSLGVGYEIGYALNLKKPVLALHHKDAFISRMITGNKDPLLNVKTYDNDEEWESIIEQFLSSL